jgi:hypothetical protein
MAKFAINYTFRTPLRTIEFSAGDETVDAEVIAAANLADVLVKDEPDGGDEPAKGSATRRPVNLKD